MLPNPANKLSRGRTKGTLRRMHSSKTVVSPSGARFRLVDHFHRRHDFEGVVIRLWVMLLFVALAAMSVAVAVDILVKQMYDFRVSVCSAAAACIRIVPWHDE